MILNIIMNKMMMTKKKNCSNNWKKLIESQVQVQKEYNLLAKLEECYQGRPLTLIVV